MLWEKSQLENHFENEKNLQTAALYSIDRKHLSKKFDLLQSFSENKKTDPAIPVKTPPLPPYSQLQQQERRNRQEQTFIVGDDGASCDQLAICGIFGKPTNSM